MDMPPSAVTRDRVSMTAEHGKAAVRRELPDHPVPRMIVVGLDESAASHAALRWAIERSQRTGDPVSAVYVYDTTPGPALRSHAVRSAREGHARARATEWIQGVLKGTHTPHTRLVVAEGSPVKVLLAATRSADLMVLGAPRPGRLRRVLINRVARRCSSRAPCPVVLVPPDSEHAEPEDQPRDSRPDEVIE